MGHSYPGEVNYAAIIGDIRKSRELPGRAGIQEKLELALESVNARFSDELVARFVVTLGDEFQGLACRAESLVRVINALDTELSGVPVRFALGWGTVTTDIRERAVGIDGPCFHHARDAMDVGKRDRRWATFSGFGDLEDEILNAFFWLMGEVRSGWTDIQAETVAVARDAESQKEVAARRGRHTSTVSKALKSALFEPLVAAERAAESVLSRADARQVGEQR